MRKRDYSEQKQHGDARRIALLINPTRVEMGKDPYSLRMVNAMIDGKRNMPDYVEEAVSKYYSAQEILKTALV